MQVKSCTGCEIYLRAYRGPAVLTLDDAAGACGGDQAQCAMTILRLRLKRLVTA